MTKTKVTDYSKTLLALTAGQQLPEAKRNFTGLLRLLAHKKQLNLWPEILTHFEQELNQQQDALIATVYYDDLPPNTQEQSKISAYLQERLRVGQVSLHLTPAAIGPGLIIEVAGTRFDLSLRGQLNKFKNQLLAT